MMDLTDRHYRFLMRRMTRHTLLYTEMLTSKAVVRGDRSRLLKFDPCEHPVVLQLGGSNPAELAEASAIGEASGYDRINLNVGCPSDRVQSGRFGACLMAEPELVGQCVRQMQAAVGIPVTVKCRIGIDRIDSWDSLNRFTEVVADYGCTEFVVHARKAWLDGLSPKENRNIPPLRYDYVYQLKQARPDLTIVINGGISDWKQIEEHLRHVDGVMLGREAYYNPARLLDADRRLFDDSAVVSSRSAVARAYATYMQGELERGTSLSSMSRHLIALYQDVPGARAWRRHLSDNHLRYDSAIELVEDALRLFAALPQQSGIG